MKPSLASLAFTILASPVAAALLLHPVTVSAQSGQPPTWGAESSPSPTASKDVAKKANAAADRGMYTEVEYANAGTMGPALVVIPGEIKSNNANFVERFLPNNIADFAELELTRANFQVLERSDLGPVLNEFVLAYNLGDPESAAQLKKGKLKTTKYVVKFDILKAEQAAAQKKGFKGDTASSLIGLLGGSSRATSAASTVAGSIDTSATAGVWVIGMRYRIIDANTTEQVAQGYTEEKMEVGTQESSVAGVESGAAGGVSLDTMVQRLAHSPERRR